MTNSIRDSTVSAFVERLSPAVCDGLVAVCDGEVLVNWRSPNAPELFDLKSITKSVVSILLGRLEFEGVLSELDMPLGAVFGELQGTPKSRITLRQIMAHTSGLDATSHSEEVFASGDVVSFALSLDIVEEPGRRFAYNNAAVNLLPEVVRRLSGVAFDDVARQLLFDPLGISDWSWKKDRTGNPLGMTGCALSPGALADLGLLMIDNGEWHGEQMLAADWRQRTTESCPPAAFDDPHKSLQDHGLLWWVLYPPDERFIIDDEILRSWRAAEPPLDPAVLERMSRLKGTEYRVEELLDAATEALLPLSIDGRAEAIEIWHENTWRRGLPDARRASDTAIGFFAQGDRGQTLLCIPRSRQVVVQLVGDETKPSSPLGLLNAVIDLCANA